MRLLLLITALVFGGCAASRQYFLPTEQVHGATLQGYPESIYTLTGAQGHFGEAKVWSRGAYRGEGGTTVVHVSIEINNTSAAPAQLSGADVRLDPVRTSDGALLSDVQPADGKLYTIPPATIREIRLHFVLPKDISPGEVAGFRVRWNVSTAAGQVYSQLTPFIEEPPHYAYYGYGYPGPYYYHYVCDPFDPLCFYPGGYYHVGVYYRPVMMAPGPRIVVHPRR